MLLDMGGNQCLKQRLFVGVESALTAQQFAERSGLLQHPGMHSDQEFIYCYDVRAQ
jgi:hypothetical protein